MSKITGRKPINTLELKLRPVKHKINIEVELKGKVEYTKNNNPNTDQSFTIPRNKIETNKKTNRISSELNDYILDTYIEHIFGYSLTLANNYTKPLEGEEAVKKVLAKIHFSYF